MSKIKKVSDETFMRAIQETQYQCIKSMIRTNYVGGFVRLLKWNDFYYSLVHFTANSIRVNMSTSSVRNRLHKLSEQGLVDKRKTYGPVSFRLPRETCDEYALQAKEFWEKQGFSENAMIHEESIKIITEERNVLLDKFECVDTSGQVNYMGLFL